MSYWQVVSHNNMNKGADLVWETERYLFRNLVSGLFLAVESQPIASAK